MVCHKPARRKNIRTNESSDFVFGSTIVKCTNPVFDGIYGCLGSFADASATAVGAAAAGAAEKDQTIGHKSRCCPCLFGRFAVAAAATSIGSRRSKLVDSPAKQQLTCTSHT